MRFAYADPPYLGCGKLYAAHHPRATDWDNPEEHACLVSRLVDEYPDGWAISLHEPSLRFYLSIVPADARVAVWVKPFAVFKPNVTRAYTWEPVIFWGGRKIERKEPTWRDHLSESITMRKGLTGAKPRRFCHWVLDGLGWQPDDDLDDIFPGTYVMDDVIRERRGTMPQIGLFADNAMEVCDHCEGTGTAGHPDSGYGCEKCGGAGGVADRAGCAVPKETT